MIPIYYDLETFWSVTHSLTKMNPISYIMHPDTELQSVSFAVDDDPIQFVYGQENVIAALRSLPWEDAMAVAHNGAGFDHLLLIWRILESGRRPKAFGCTASMARPFFGVKDGVSLAATAKQLDIKEEKGSLESVNTKGLRVADWTPDMIRKMEAYNNPDTSLCRKIFKTLAPRIGKHEMRLIDASIRMTVYPQFEADIPLLARELVAEKERKRQSLLELARMLGVQHPTDDATEQAMRDVIMSQPQFRRLIEMLGVAVPLKESKTAKDEDGFPKMIPALAKNDKGMKELLEFEDPCNEDLTRKVQVAAATRLEVKTTQLETRLATFINVANACGGKLPMPVNYCGAYVTWRMSGAMKMNCQNMPRINKVAKASDALRQSVRAPAGKKVVVVDSSNIELRVAHMLAGEQNTINLLRQGTDLYCWFASRLFGRTITKADTLERFIGKVAMLSLQYGSSWRTYKEMVRVQSGGATILDDTKAEETVYLWRDTFPAIAGKRGIWTRCNTAIGAMASGSVMDIDRDGLVSTMKGHLITPQDHWLQYPALHMERDPQFGGMKWWYGSGRNRHSIYGAHLFENICQHLARIIVMEQTLAVDKHFPVALSCHDEAVFVVDDDQATACEALALREFSRPPVWWPSLPLAAEAGIGQTYAEAK